jgi:hypothetical protein
MQKIQNVTNVKQKTKTKNSVNAKKTLIKKSVRIALGLIRMIYCVAIFMVKIRTEKSAMIVPARIRICLCVAILMGKIGSERFAMIVRRKIGI